MHSRLTRLIIAVGLLAFGTGSIAQTGVPDARFLDVLDMHGMPASPTDRSFNIFFDAGAWHGYSLPPAGDDDTGFAGPFVHSLGDGRWVGQRFARVLLREAGTHQDIMMMPTESHAAPGYLVRRFSSPSVSVDQILFFANSSQAVARIELKATRALDINVTIAGQVMPDEANGLAARGEAVAQTFAHSPSILSTALHGDGVIARRVTVAGAAYRIDLNRPLHLEPHQTAVLYVDQVLVYDPHTGTSQALDDATAWMRNRERWAGYLASIAKSHLAGLPDDVAQRVAVKAIITLLGNWRAARGDLHHDGVIPSYSNPDFNGFWAWDSWKHAAALALFAPDLARDQMRAMFDYQTADGMVPDCIYLDKANDNWRDTKPPLATWATLAIYRATGDKAFLAEMYDRLVRYHRWWFGARDHDHNGLAEYGSTDGTAIAAKWESGMDNAVRFDTVIMLKNGEGAWSMNQESVDLNAYLYKEKIDLATIAKAIGKSTDARQWLKEAAAMREAIQTRMYDRQYGYFFDARLGRDDRVRVYGSEGWAPLWASIASPEEAARVVSVMLDPHKFATYMPFPTLAQDDPHFSPITGYWRGPVWLDQAYFGVEALRRYGYAKQADDMARRLVLNAIGLTAQAPMYENYDPLTGQGYQSANFSWAAASYLLLLR
ncbi:MGH1-like glycoside hydrolase domain-containing protein [Dyella psychrodurans]|uniref:Glycoside hydrolase n=1 Tax=Dyella psychrodurans TaxID=1927960 RepID=A0A370XCL9_9GAMM|nr:trehalase family glycosidase [Dyella psychrodurans]RDS86146.1 glycoside hydrolase [Dyella psychrodurans]